VTLLWLLLTAVWTFPGYRMPLALRLLYWIDLGFVALLVTVSLLSALFSPYSIVVDGKSLVIWFLVACAPQIYGLWRGPGVSLVRSRPRWSPAARSSDRVPPGAIGLDLIAGLLIAASVVIECGTPRATVHIVADWFSLPAALIPFLLSLSVSWIRHRTVPQHPVLRRLFPGWSGQMILDDEARLFAPAGERRSKRMLEAAAAVVGFSVLVAVVTWPQMARLDSVPDLGDPLFSVWRIAWIAHQITRAPLHLFDGNMFYPEHLTLALSDPVIVPGLMSAPLFWLGAHRVAAYNLLFLSGFALSGATTYLFVRALTGRRDAGIVAGIAFAVYPYRFEHYSHLELQMTMWAPLALWGLHRSLARGRLGDGLGTGLAFALQTLSSLYYGLFLLVYMSVVGLVLWLARGRPLAPIRALAAGGIIAGLLIAPVAVEFVRNRPVFSERDSGAVEFYSAVAADYLKPHERSRLYSTWSEGGRAERQLFPGFMVFALAVVALWPPVRPVRLAYAAAMIVAFDGSLGAHGIIFPYLREFVPPFRGLRVPARFSIFVGLTFAVLAGFAVRRLAERWPRWRLAIVGMAAGLVIADMSPRLELVPVWNDPPPIYGTLSSSAPAVLAEFPAPPDWRAFWWDARFIYFSTFHWQRLINGNSGVSPPSYLDFIDHVQTFPDRGSLAYLRRRGVEYIGVHGAFYTQDDWRRVRDELDRSSELQLVASAPWSGSESRLYRLKR